jgi:hypothetical protein
MLGAGVHEIFNNSERSFRVSTNAKDARSTLIGTTIIGLPLITVALLAWTGVLNDNRSLSLLIAGAAGLAGLVLAVSAFRVQAPRLRIGLVVLAAGMLCTSAMRFAWMMAAPSGAMLGATLLTLIGTLICLSHFRSERQITGT